MLIELLYLGSILFSAIMAFICRKHLPGRMLTILISFLFLVFAQETVLWLNNQFKLFDTNAIVYNIYRPISVIVFSFIYFRIPFMSSLRKIVGGVTMVYLLGVLANYFFIESIFTTSSYLPVARGFVITFCGILFLFQYFNLDNFQEERYWRPLVWITAGVVVFYPVVTTSLAFQKYLAAENATWLGLKLYHIIPQIMSIFMYNCFSYAFYLCQKIK